MSVIPIFGKLNLEDYYKFEIILLLPKSVSQTSLAYNVGELCLKNKSK